MLFSSLLLSTGSHHVYNVYHVCKFTPHVVASPNAPQKPLVRKRARSRGANWVQVSRIVAPSPAKKPRTRGSQQPTCTHTEHHILTTTEAAAAEAAAAEAAAFAAQFWDKKTHPTQASQHEFLATCIDVDLEQDVKHAQAGGGGAPMSWPLWKGATMKMKANRIRNNA